MNLHLCKFVGGSGQGLAPARGFIGQHICPSPCINGAWELCFIGGRSHGLICDRWLYMARVLNSQTPGSMELTYDLCNKWRAGDLFIV